LAEQAEAMINPGQAAAPHDDKPISSRIKSVIPWQERKFEIDSKESQKIKSHLNTELLYKEFTDHIASFPHGHHPNE